jgi:hypothetical protein
MLAHVFDDTPTRLPPPPRVLHGGEGCLLWGVRLFILPHTCIGLFLMGQFVLSLLIAAFGTDRAATVTGTRAEPASKGGTIYYIDYRYVAGGREYTNSETVGAVTYARVSGSAQPEGRPVTVRVRHLELGPSSPHLFAQGHSVWGTVGERLLIALFWNGIVSVFVYVLWVAPIRKYLLLRHGQTTTGRVVSTRERKGKGTTYLATFCFRDPESGREIEREMEVAGEPLYVMAQGRPEVTVVYSPRNPRRAIAYELSGYRVEAG